MSEPTNMFQTRPGTPQTLPLSEGGRGIDEDAVRLAKAAPLLLEALKEAREALTEMALHVSYARRETDAYPAIAKIDSAIAAATRE